MPSLQAYGSHLSSLRLIPFRLAALYSRPLGDPDWRLGRFLAAEQVPQRSLQVRLAELVPGRDQALRPDVLAGLGDFPGPFVAEQQPGPNPGTGSSAGRRSTPASVLV